MSLIIEDGQPNARIEVLLKSREEQWIKSIRLKEELIRHPFSSKIVEKAIRYFGSKHRPWLPYTSDSYDTILVAESDEGGYFLNDPTEDWEEMKFPATWREWAEEREQPIEEFAAENGITEDWYDEPLDHEYYIDSLGPYSGPLGSAYFLLEDVLWGHDGEFPIGQIGFVAGDSPMNSVHYVMVAPKVSLTFLQIFLDWKKTGIKIVLEDEWLKIKNNG
jgi:hypothetical protein